MGKLSKKISKKKEGVINRVSLFQQISHETQETKSTQNINYKAHNNQKYIDAKLSSNIITQAKEQLEELNEDFGSFKPYVDAIPKILNEEEPFIIEEFEDHYLDAKDLYYDKIELAKEDEMAFDKFMNSDIDLRQSMADMISERLTEKKTELNSQILGDLEIDPITKLDPKVVELYRGVGKILSQYRSGKLPKAFKIIPALADWESVMQLTGPDKWSSAAMYQATRLFASNLNVKLAQRFYNKVLLPRVRDDIAEYKKLNFHLYQALYKSMFKPAAFFKGILIPLVDGEGSEVSCSLREAFIIGGVIHKNSVPLLHSCAAILKLVELSGHKYSGPLSIFLRVLLSKNYVLPTRVMSNLLSYFTSFTNHIEPLPVLWHQSLLTFAQNYKSQMTTDDKDSLRDLVKHQPHEKISPVILEELSKEAPCPQSVVLLNEEIDEDILME